MKKIEEMHIYIKPTCITYENLQQMSKTIRLF